MNTETSDPEEQARNVYARLSNKDTLLIFKLAEKGLNASLDSLERHNFSKKRYYTRLKELVELGLVFKDKGVYKHTSLGSLIFESQVRGLKHIMSNKNALKVVQELSRNDKVSKVDLEKITRVTLGEIESFFNVCDLKPVRISDRYEDMLSTIEEQIYQARETVYLASRFIEPRAVERTLKNLGSRANIRIIISNRGNLEARAQMLAKVMADPNLIDLLIDMATQYGDRIQIKHAALTYGFAVIDREAVAIELVNPANPENFFIGFMFKSHALAGKLIEYFEETWLWAEDDPMVAAFDEAREKASRKGHPVVKMGKQEIGRDRRTGHDTFAL